MQINTDFQVLLWALAVAGVFPLAFALQLATKLIAKFWPTYGNALAAVFFSVLPRYFITELYSNSIEARGEQVSPQVNIAVVLFSTIFQWFVYKHTIINPASGKTELTAGKTFLIILVQTVIGIGLMVPISRLVGLVASLLHG